MARFQGSDGVFRFFERCLDECSDIGNADIAFHTPCCRLALSRLGFCPRQYAQYGRQDASQQVMPIVVTLSQVLCLACYSLVSVHGNSSLKCVDHCSPF